jgi:hypothetical protein
MYYYLSMFRSYLPYRRLGHSDDTGAKGVVVHDAPWCERFQAAVFLGLLYSHSEFRISVTFSFLQ